MDFLLCIAFLRLFTGFSGVLLLDQRRSLAAAGADKPLVGSRRRWSLYQAAALFELIGAETRSDRWPYGTGRTGSPRVAAGGKESKERKKPKNRRDPTQKRAPRWSSSAAPR